MNCSLDELQSTCINRALTVAVQSKHYVNVHQLLLKGVTYDDIDKVLPFVEDKAEYVNMVLVKGVVGSDQELVSILCESCQQPDGPLSPAELRKLACNLPLKISLRQKDITVVQSLITGDDGTVANWSNLQLLHEDMQLLSTIAGAQDIKILLLTKNQLTSLPLSIANFQQVRNRIAIMYQDYDVTSMVIIIVQNRINCMHC